MQEPGTAYSVNGSTIIFSAAPANTEPFFGVMLGDVLDVGTISNGLNINAATLRVTGSAVYANTLGVGNTTGAATGAGVTFPATQSPSTDVNTLDDYEEGTWTPVFQGSTNAGTYTLSGPLANYCKIGSLVYLSFYTGFSVVSGGTGYLQVANTPFTKDGSHPAVGSVRFANVDMDNSAKFANLLFITTSATTVMFFSQSVDAGGSVDMLASAVNTSSTVYGSICYRST